MIFRGQKNRADVRIKWFKLIWQLHKSMRFFPRQHLLFLNFNFSFHAYVLWPVHHTHSPHPVHHTHPYPIYNSNFRLIHRNLLFLCLFITLIFRIPAFNVFIQLIFFIPLLMLCHPFHSHHFCSDPFPSQWSTSSLCHSVLTFILLILLANDSSHSSSLLLGQFFIPLIILIPMFYPTYTSSQSCLYAHPSPPSFFLSLFILFFHCSHPSYFFVATFNPTHLPHPLFTTLSSHSSLF